MQKKPLTGSAEFSQRKAVVDTRNADAELAQIQEDYKIYEEAKKTTRKPDSGKLFRTLIKAIVVPKEILP